MYKLRITAKWYDDKGNGHYRVNELPISEEVAVGLKHDAQGVFPCPIKGKGSIYGDIDVEILRDDEVFGGWRGM